MVTIRSPGMNIPIAAGATPLPAPGEMPSRGEQGYDASGRLFGHVCGPEGFAPVRTPRVFMYQVAGATLRLCGIRLAIVQGLDARDMTQGFKGAVNMATLAVFGDDLVADIRRQCSLQSFVEWIDSTRREAQKRDHETQGIK
jgi:hypothetical protein